MWESKIENIFAFHIDVRGLKTNFEENFPNFMNNAGTFLYHLPNGSMVQWFQFNFFPIPFERKTNKRGGSILIYVKIDLINILVE